MYVLWFYNFITVLSNYKGNLGNAHWAVSDKTIYARRLFAVSHWCVTSPIFRRTSRLAYYIGGQEVDNCRPGEETSGRWAKRLQWCQWGGFESSMPGVQLKQVHFQWLKDNYWRLFILKKGTEKRFVRQVTGRRKKKNLERATYKRLKMLGSVFCWKKNSSYIHAVPPRGIRTPGYIMWINIRYTGNYCTIL